MEQARSGAGALMVMLPAKTPGPLSKKWYVLLLLLLLLLFIFDLECFGLRNLLRIFYCWTFKLNMSLQIKKPLGMLFGWCSCLVYLYQWLELTVIIYYTCFDKDYSGIPFNVSAQKYENVTLHWLLWVTWVTYLVPLKKKKEAQLRNSAWQSLTGLCFSNNQWLTLDFQGWHGSLFTHPSHGGHNERRWAFVLFIYLSKWLFPGLMSATLKGPLAIGKLWELS